MLAVASFTKSYEILSSALEDAERQHEETAAIIAECSATIELIREYRIQMNETVSKYLYEHIETFKAGFNAMDQAILAGDVNGYISGNNEIQEILHYDIQFHNDEEFNELMDSDESFKL